MCIRDSFKAIHHLCPGLLLHVAMQSLRQIAAKLQVADQLVHLSLGVAKHNGQMKIIQINYPAQNLRTFGRRKDVYKRQV